MAAHIANDAGPAVYRNNMVYIYTHTYTHTVDAHLHARIIGNVK